MVTRHTKFCKKSVKHWLNLFCAGHFHFKESTKSISRCFEAFAQNLKPVIFLSDNYRTSLCVKTKKNYNNNNSNNLFTNSDDIRGLPHK